jgi:S1-C subfamily serine protease
LPYRIAVFGLGSALLIALVLLGVTLVRPWVVDPPAPQSFAVLYRAEAPGVVRIDATTCDGGGVGSGFLLSPRLVATVGHVVAGATAIDVTAGSHTSSGRLVGMDPNNDVALIRTASPLSGHTFQLAGTVPPVGTPVGVIGYPEGGPLSFSQGTVSGLNRTIEVAGTAHANMIQTDAPIDPGNSGGPLIDLEGRVVGLVDAVNSRAADIGYAVPASLAQPSLVSWSRNPMRTTPAACAGSEAQQTSGPVQANNSSPEAIRIAGTLSTYFNAIDDGDYQAAYAQFTASGQTLVGSEKRFALSEATSYDFDIGLGNVTVEAPTVAVADVTFRSVQTAATGPDGDTCDNWTLAYTMVRIDGSWMIEEARGVNGVTHTAC